MTATRREVFVQDGYVFENSTDCHRCKHPPKPKGKASPKAGPGGPGSAGGSGDGSGSGSGTGGGSGSGTGGSGSGSAPVNASTSSTTGSDDGSGSGSGSGPRPKPRPQFPFPITLFDSTGTGWFNDSVAWTDVPFYGNTSVEWYDSRDLPATLTGPEYIISTIDGLRIIHQNTICGALYREDCEERLPDGKFIFRVTGAVSKWDTFRTASWFFCGVHGTSMEQLEFTMIHGKCFPGPKITSHEMCYGTPLSVLFTGTMMLSGVGDVTLSEFDTALLENDIAESFSSVLPGLHGAVAITAWEVEKQGLLVTFELRFNPAQYGMDGMLFDTMEQLSSTLLTSASSYVSSGNFMSFLQSGLTDLPAGSHDILSSVSDISFAEMKYVQTYVQHEDKAAESAPVLSSEIVDVPASSSSSSDATLASFERSAAILAAVIFGAALVVYLSSRYYVSAENVVEQSSRELLSDESSRSIESSSAEGAIPNFA